MLAGALALVAPLAALAQTNAVPARITTQINESNLTTLHGNRHPLARPQFDQGAVADSQPMRRMLLLLQRSPQQETALKTLIDQQQSKSSSNYHQWLTPHQFGQQYGTAPADIQAVTSWLQSHGFQIARVATGGTLIEFSGTAGQVRDAFHTEIHRYAVNGEQHFANNSDPQIPAALASVVAGPVTLHNFPRKPQSRVRGTFQKDKTTGIVTPIPTPAFTFNSSMNCSSSPFNSIFNSNCYVLGPGDFAAIYNVNPLWTTGINGHVIDGSGQTIAIVGDSEICTVNAPGWQTSYFGPNGTLVTCSMDDVAQFRSQFGLPAISPNVILDGPDPGFNSDEIEGDLDVEWSGAIAKNATIDFVIAEGTEASAGTDLAAEYIVDNNVAPVMSESFSACEALLGQLGTLFEYELWEQAAAEGITVIVSAGDSGSAGCDDNSTESTAINGQNVNGIASTPFNVAAGGTDFDFTVANYPAQYWADPNSNSTVNGIKNVSALGYIPETPWNDSCARTGASGCNSLPANSPLLNIVGGGGGQSDCVNFDSVTGFCDPAYPNDPQVSLTGWVKPSYQLTATGSGLTVGTDLTRDVPDISLFAADGTVSNSFYIVCESDFPTTVTPCSVGQTINFVGVGGTSSSAPAFAGIMALVNQNMVVNHSMPTGQGQGNANYVLYPLFSNQVTAGTSCNSSASPNTTSVTGCTFYDVTKGNNSVPCAAMAFQCSDTGIVGTGIVETGTPLNAPSYTAGAGYDLATGLGSVNAFNLVSNWFGTVGTFTPTTTTLCLSATSNGCASSLSASTVTNPIPHGTPVYVSIGVTSGKGAPPASALNQAEDVALIGTFPAPCTTNCTQGVDRFDANTFNFDIYPLGSGGTVNNISTTELVGGTYNVSARYGGDGTFGSSTSSPVVPITVTPEQSTTTVHVGTFSPTGAIFSNPVAYGAVDIIRADVVGASGLETGTGNVTLLDNGAPIVNSFDTTANTFPLNTEGYTEDQTAFLSVGAHNFTAQYAGDASYMASSSTGVALTVSQGVTTATISSSATSIAANAPITLTATLDTLSAANPSGGSFGLSPSGMVTFMAGGTSLGNANLSAGPLDAGGFVTAQATLSNVTTLTSTVSITAVYNGDSNYTGSTSTGVTVTVGSPGINPPSGCSTAITIAAPGQSGSCLITVTGANGFAGTVTLVAAVSSTPTGAVDLPTCTFGPPDQNFTAPNTITLSAASETGNATMTCSSMAASHILLGPSSRPSGHGRPLAGAVMVLACLFLLLTAARQRRWGLVPLAVLLFVVAAAGISCNGGGYGGGGGPVNPGTTAGAYTYKVTATPSSGTAQSTTVTVNVQ